MALPTPDTPKEVQDDAKTDVQRDLPEANPNLPNSWISALIVGYSNRLFDNYQNVDDAVNEAFYDTSSEKFLIRQASFYNIFRLDETQASGIVVFGGTAGKSVSTGQEVVASNGVTVVMDEDVDVIFQQFEVASITPSGSIAIVTMTDDHFLSPGILVTISGADEVSEGDIYDGTFPINVTGDKTFTYEMSDSTIEIPTGTILAAWNSGSGQGTTSDFGIETNLESLTRLSVSPEQEGIDVDAYVDFSGFSGGSNQETTEELRERLLFRVGNPVANFNVAAIEQQALAIVGVTRVFVFETTPALGQVTTYFMRDNDDDPIPDAQEITDVKNSILEIKPANTSDTDVIVLAPVAVTQPFDFNLLTPNTETMQSSVEAKLEEFFATGTELGEDVTSEQYTTAILNTVDTTTGDAIEDFQLTNPVGDITVSSGEIAVLGAVAFPVIP